MSDYKFETLQLHVGQERNAASPLQTTSPMEPGRCTAVPGLMGLFLRQNDKKQAVPGLR